MAALTGPKPLSRRKVRWGRAAILLVAAIYFIGPLAASFWFSISDKLHGGVTAQAYTGLRDAPGFGTAVMLSLRLSIATVIIGLALMIPTMLIVHLRLPSVRPAVEILSLLPLVIPPVVLVAGVASVLSWGPNQLAGTPMQSLISTLQSGSMPWVLALEYVILTLPFTYRALDSGLSSIPLATLVEAARGLGAGWISITLRVLLPSLRTAVLNAAFLSFALVFGEYTIAKILIYTPFSVWIAQAAQTDGQQSTSLSLMSLLLTWVLLILISGLGRSTRSRRALA
jgi:putative spermidine/putrescine transport system permease protein